MAQLTLTKTNPCFFDRHGTLGVVLNPCFCVRGGNHWFQSLLYFISFRAVAWTLARWPMQALFSLLWDYACQIHNSLAYRDDVQLWHSDDKCMKGLGRLLQENKAGINLCGQLLLSWNTLTKKVAVFLYTFNVCTFSLLILYGYIVASSYSVASPYVSISRFRHLMGLVSLALIFHTDWQISVITSLL